MTASYLEESFMTWLNRERIPPPEREYRFHPTRRWRLDMAWLGPKVAVEIEGVLPGGGRHQKMVGFIQDCEKMEAALLLDWKVMRVPGPWVAEGERTIWRPQTMVALRYLLGIG